VSEPVLPPLAGARALDLLGVGECSLDTRVLVEALPPPGGKGRVLEWRELPGGQVATAVLAAARLGLRAAYAGAVGDDARAEPVLAPLRRAGVDVSRVVRVAGAATRAALILVERGTGERTVLGQRDEKLGEARAELARLALGAARLLLLDATDLALATALAERARAEGVPVLLDLDAPAPGFERLLAQVDFPVVSRGFAEAAYGGAEPALARLAALGARLPVVTLGAEGALAWSGGRLLASPAFAVEVVDTTGAGDVFHGAFAWGLHRGLGAAELLRAANAAAAFACTGSGAQGALPDAGELRALLARGHSSS
jgi:sugar/nucleoside kinase (ribokinase family)